MLNPNLDYDADTLACALALTGKATPTRAELTAALGLLNTPNCGGLKTMPPAGPMPTVNELLAAGWLVPTIDGRGLRVPPLSLAEQDARLAAYESKTALVPEGVSELYTPSLPAAYELKTEFVPNSRSKAEGGSAAGHLFSYYRDGIATTTPYAAVTPAQLWAVLVSSRQRAQTEALRAAAVGSPERADLKKRLDYVTPAGTFTRRANAGLVTASGLLILDFDHLPDVAAARAALLADTLLAPELVLMFVSPSGDGLKALVTADPAAAHLDTFRAYADYLGRTYAALGLQPDEAGKDVARACFVPYAPDAWLAPAYAA
jgi:hypothetical protein